MCHSQGRCPGHGQIPDCPHLPVVLSCVGIPVRVCQGTRCSSEPACICPKYHDLLVIMPRGIILHVVLCRKHRCAKNIRPHTAAHPGPTQLVCSLRSHAEVTLQSQGAERDRLQKSHPSSSLLWGPGAADTEPRAQKFPQLQAPAFLSPSSTRASCLDN